MEVKEPSTFQQQLEKIKTRGCIVSDENFAIDILHKINYYRFTAYFLPFKQRNDNYKTGTAFNTVYKIYEFDQKMRNILSAVIEDIELTLRTQISYYHAFKHGSLGYLEAFNFNNKHNHNAFLKHIRQDIHNNRNQPAIKHHLQTYEGKFPIWVILEYSTMGELSYFYSDMIREDKKELASIMFKSSGFDSTDKNVSSWLLCLTHLRNYCAHYCRLYYFLFPAIPATPENINYTLGKRLFDYIMVLRFLYPDKLQWKNGFVVNLENLIEEYKNEISLEHIGFPKNWLQLLEE